MSLLNQRLWKLGELNFKDNPLGTRMENFLKDPAQCDTYGVRLATLVLDGNLHVLKSAPLLWGTSFRDQLKELKFDSQLFLIASSAEFLFKWLDKHQRHQRLKYMDQMGSKEILTFLQSFDDVAWAGRPLSETENCAKNKKFWKKIGQSEQDRVLARLNKITEDKIRIIFKNFGQFFSFFKEWRYIILSEFVGLMNNLTPEILQTTLDNQAVLFQSSLGANEIQSKIRSMFYEIQKFTTKEAFDAFIKTVKDNEANWFRYGTTPKERDDRIWGEMVSARKT